MSTQSNTQENSQRRGVITLLHKGKDLARDAIKNWRPITLTNSDYKIYSKVLANRLQPMLASIIHQNQSGFVKGRSIENHIRAIDDIIQHATAHNSQGMMVSIDFQKAFDTVSHGSIISALKIFNFGDTFINLVRVLLSNTESCIQNGGWLSKWFKVQQGIKQGCGVSPILFILTAELLAIKIRNNKKIKAIPIKYRSKKALSTKILQYADDTTLLIQDHSSLKEALNDIQIFSDITGLKLNKTKSMAMWLGQLRESKATYGDITWIQNGETMKILGIHFRAFKEASLIEENWKDKIKTIIKTIKVWQKRNLSLHGKVLICKTFLLSQITYVLKSLSLPHSVIKEIDTLIFKFIWQKKYSDKRAFEKVKRDIICKNIEDEDLE